ncbi:SDR family oxidoreductase [Candidatus Falkowbacteria bacterium]|nr:SDR family oxidoreductase [Candidatus Falkowbacteria bacterium]
MFKEKTVLVTGGSSGIGKVAAILFAQQGADVVITYKSNKEGAKDTVKEIRKLKRKAIAIKADLIKEGNAKRVAEKALEKFGKIDVLVNNAGRYIDGDEWDGESKVWIESLGQNLVSVMNMSKYAAEAFKRQGRGVIVNVASELGHSGSADAISYGAAKAGIVNVTKAYAKLLSSSNGRANSVSPGAANVGYWLTAPKEELEERIARTPNHRLVEPAEVAQKIAYLASDEASAINGQDFLIE